MTAPDGFLLFPLSSGLVASYRQAPFPCEVAGWEASGLEVAGGATHFGIVFQGEAELTCASGRFPLRAGMYFAAPGEAAVRGAPLVRRRRT